LLIVRSRPCITACLYVLSTLFFFLSQYVNELLSIR